MLLFVGSCVALKAARAAGSMAAWKFSQGSAALPAFISAFSLLPNAVDYSSVHLDSLQATIATTAIALTIRKPEASQLPIQLASQSSTVVHLISYSQAW